ncbi:MAG: thioredoxin family protein [Cetobacterium sp.]|uniref:thioredoxin family protein n=2 Tax=Fusobacteriaceae TaxID=203492 RepID=UPI001F051D53|nr:MULTISPECIES: thioredoxin family protein [Cetobacterium]MCX3067047.1 thioredoxin family protein [Cetobacterium somerae]UPO98763.1 thioredoxin family protein [Cetobacterium somerae]
MEIKVLGGCCKSCDVLLDYVNEVLVELDKKANVEKITDFVEIAKLGVLKTPGIVIDGKVIFSGRMADKKEVKEILSKY